ncbi:MAG TPA: hypothetical protein VNH83_25875 [Bryobacteraceae bacterium]|nr:hypothetical protein [Bryobacteraceae bacterium]
MRAIFATLCLAFAAVAAPPRERPTQVRIPLWLDASPSHELSPKDFTATIDGVSSHVLQVQCPDAGLVILVVLDLSSGDLTLADPAKEALNAEIRKLSPNTFVGLLRAQDGLTVLHDPIADRDVIAALVAEQTLSGKTGLLATIDTASRIADAMLDKSAVRVAILYLTDGDVRNYREDFTNPVINSSDSHDLSRRFPETLVQEKIAKLDAILASEQAPVFIINVGQQTDRLNEAYQNGMKQLAETTGGAAFFSRSTTEIPEAIRRGFDAVASHYSLTLGLPEHVSRRPQIHVALAEGGRSLTYRTRIVLRTRK